MEREKGREANADPKDSRVGGFKEGENDDREREREEKGWASLKGWN